MYDLGLSDPKVFEKWREEERVYLEGLSKEPITETLEMEYYQKLMNLRASESVFKFCNTPVVCELTICAGKTLKQLVQPGCSQHLQPCPQVQGMLRLRLRLPVVMH